MRDKRGFELAISTLIVIVLAVIVLVALIFAFTGGFQRFWSYVQNLFPSDVQAVKTACFSACQSNQEYDFCIRERNVKDIGKITCQHSAINVTCENIKC